MCIKLVAHSGIIRDITVWDQQAKCAPECKEGIMFKQWNGLRTDLRLGLAMIMIGVLFLLYREAPLLALGLLVAGLVLLYFWNRRRPPAR